MSELRLDANGVVVSCPNCGQANRLGYARTDARSNCGKCGTRLPAPADPIEVPDAASFDAAIGAATLPVVVDFWAPWCAPCRMVAPEIARVAQRNQGRYLIVKVNTDAIPELGDRYRIQSIPTMAVFAGGREVARTAGARPAAEIERFIESAVRA